MHLYIIQQLPVSVPDGGEEVVDLPPHDNPQAQHQASHYREDDGQEQVYEEWEECPTGEADHHEDDAEHVGDDPGNDQILPVEESSKYQHGGEDEVQSRCDHDRGQDLLVVPVKPLQAPQHSMVNLELWKVNIVLDTKSKSIIEK